MKIYCSYFTSSLAEHPAPYFGLRWSMVPEYPLGQAEFWFETFKNLASKFLSVFSIVILTILWLEISRNFFSKFLIVCVVRP